MVQWQDLFSSMTTNINLPKGPGSWPDQEKSQRSETYKDLLDLKGGTYKAGRDNLASTVLEKVSDPKRNYGYWDVISMTEKSTMPVSTIIQNAFKQGGESKPKELMQYSLDYLVNGEENKGGNFNKGKEVNIDRVVKGDLVYIKLDPATNRWILEVFDQSLKDIKDGEKSEQYLKMKGFLFPPSRLQTSSTGPEADPANTSQSTPSANSDLKFKENDVKDEYAIKVDGKPGALLPQSNEYLEVADPKLFAEGLLAQYDSMGVEPFMKGLDGLTPSAREQVLTVSFNLLGQQSPEKAYKLMQEITTNEQSANKWLLSDEMDRLASLASNAGREDEGRFWNLQKIFALGGADHGDIDIIRNIYKIIGMIDKTKLAPELKTMLEENEKSLDLVMKRALALDMINSSLNQAGSTFKDPEGLAELKAMGRSALSDELENGWNDNDADVFLSNAHVTEALRLLVAYQYPKDLMAGVKIDNPISYYFEQIRNGSIQTIEIPKGVTETVQDPVGNGFSYPDGGILDLSQLFVNRSAELRIFDEYQKGNENLGESTIWGGYIGNAGAFMGNETPDGARGQIQRGLINGSDQLFARSMFEKNGELGTVEQLYLEKIKESMKLGRYDEARDLCVQVLADPLKGKKALTKTEIDAKTNELWTDWKTPIEAQVTLDLDAKGITDADAKRIPNENGGFYRDRADFINATARKVVEGKATLELQSEPAEALYNDPSAQSSLNGLQKAALEQMAELNGYGTFDLKEENYDFGVSVAKTVTEITVTTVALSATGGLAAGALGASEFGTVGATMAMRGMEAGRVLSAGERAFLLGRGLNAGRTIPGLTRLAEGLSTGTGYSAAIGRNVLSSTGFVESMRAMHGDSLNIANTEGLMEVAATGATLGVLNGTQSFLRGGMSGTRAIGGLSQRLGGLNTSLRSYGYLGAAGANALEAVPEFGMMLGLSKVQKELSVATGLISRTQAEAMEHPDYSEWAHLAGVVLGLRTWRMATAARAPEEVVRTEPEPTPEPAREPVADTPAPTEPVVEPKTPTSEPVAEPVPQPPAGTPKPKNNKEAPSKEDRKVIESKKDLKDTRKIKEPSAEPAKEPAIAEVAKPHINIPTSQTELRTIMVNGRSGDLIEIMKRDMGSILGRGFESGGKERMADSAQFGEGRKKLEIEVAGFLKEAPAARSFEPDYLDASRLLTELQVKTSSYKDPNVSRIIEVLRNALTILQGASNNTGAGNGKEL